MSLRDGAGALSRRELLELAGAGAGLVALTGLTGCSGRTRCDRRVVALGLDGMDPALVTAMIRAGRLPTFARLARDGAFSALRTSDPPQSPVAWASFITGANPGRHGIFDFVHRDPHTLIPYLSTSRTEAASRTATLFDYVVPLSSATVTNLRKGRAFWDVLADHDVPATVFKIPSNFPPSEGRQRTFSGMGTPDVLGTYGIFSYFSDEEVTLDETLGGGRVGRLELRDHRAEASLLGPPNTFRVGSPASRVGFEIHRDPVNRAARLTVQGQEVLLAEGEWSPWVHLSFGMVGPLDVKGICRFLLRRVHPHLHLYVTPINIDPASPSLPLSTPEGWASELAEAVGPFHTKGLPADTKALDQGVLDDDQFLEQDDLFLEEKLALYDHLLGSFDSGLLFFYISSTDQRSHMFWRLRDRTHPSWDEGLARRNGEAIGRIYERMDRLVGETLHRVGPETLVLAFSDHGFAPYYRSVHLNSWLRDAGFLAVGAPRRGHEPDLYHDVDWSRTRAYAMGFNSLYVNVRGREREGSVAPADANGVADELVRRLAELRDPATGAAVVARARKTRDCYRGPEVAQAPEVIVGYGRGYRASWQTALGTIPAELVRTNDSKWSGDHCMDSSVVPGVFFANRARPRSGSIGLGDVTATILQAFGVPTEEGGGGTPVV